MKKTVVVIEEEGENRECFLLSVKASLHQVAPSTHSKHSTVISLRVRSEKKWGLNFCN